MDIVTEVFSKLQGKLVEHTSGLVKRGILVKECLSDLMYLKMH